MTLDATGNIVQRVSVGTRTLNLAPVSIGMLEDFISHSRAVVLGEIMEAAKAVGLPDDPVAVQVRQALNFFSTSPAMSIVRVYTMDWRHLAYFAFLRAKPNHKDLEEAEIKDWHAGMVHQAQDKIIDMGLPEADGKAEAKTSPKPEGGSTPET